MSSCENSQSPSEVSNPDSSEEIVPSKVFDCKFQHSDDQPEYFFETDHDALRGNPDYLALLRTMALLQAQKVQAVKDIDVLLEARNSALRDPLAFVERLQRGEKMELPVCQRLPEMPNINWDKYNLASLHQKKPETRNSKVSSESELNDESDYGFGLREQVSGIPGAKVERNAHGQYLVRGRLFDPNSKPKTFNQPWTPEEQRRLEQLLLEFPSEDIEMERWKKIATALGNRTPVQVQSRIQKYFLKLQKAGLPVPGKLSKHSKQARSTGGSFNRTGKNGSGMIAGSRNSSFFPDLKPTVQMSEADELSADMIDHFGGDPSPNLWSEQSGSTGHYPNEDYYLELEDVSDEEGVPDDAKSSAEYKELLWLKRIRREKEWQLREGGKQVHRGFKCDGCQMEPIQGGRFSCVDCLQSGDSSVDFCIDCAPNNLEIPEVGHTTEHLLKPARRKLTERNDVDKDYVVSKGNYLDPNFVK